MRRWILFDTENLDADMMITAGTIAAVDTSLDGSSFLRTAADTLRSALSMGTGVLFLILLSLLLAAWLLLAGKNLWYRLSGLCAVGGGFLIIVYFTYTGRAPDRVWLAILMAQASALLCLTASGTEERRGLPSVWAANLILALTLLLAGRSLYLSGFHRPQLSLTARTGYEALEGDLAETFRDDDLYVWNAGSDTWYSAINNTYTFRGKLPSEGFFEHNICTGNWLYGQHYYKDYFARLDAANPAEALLYREHTYLVSYDTWPFLEYLQEHYGDQVTAEPAGELMGIPVWRFSPR